MNCSGKSLLGSLVVVLLTFGVVRAQNKAMTTVGYLNEYPESNLTNVVLRVVTVVTQFARYDIHLTLDSNGNVVLHPSFSVDLLKALQFSMNFTCTYLTASTWGNYDETTLRWDGMVGKLLDGQADLALGLTNDLPARRQAVDFCLVTKAPKCSALYRVPTFIHDNTAHVRPFKMDVWLTLVVWYVIMATTFLLCRYIPEFHCVSQENSYQQHDPSEKSSSAFYNGIFYTLSILCSKGIKVVHRQPAQRIVLVTGLLGTTILQSVYTGTLLAFLSFATVPFNSLNQLLSTSYVFAVHDIYITHQRLSDTSSDSVKEAYQRRDVTSRPPNVFHAKSDILRGSYILLTDDWSADVSLKAEYSIQERCAIGRVHLPVYDRMLGLMVPKKSPLQRAFHYQILKAKQCGLVQLWRKRHIPKPPECMITWSYEAISFGSVMVAVYVQIIGTFIALTSFAGQKCLHIKQSLKQGDIIL